MVSPSGCLIRVHFSCHGWWGQRSTIRTIMARRAGSPKRPGTSAAQRDPRWRAQLDGAAKPHPDMHIKLLPQQCIYWLR
jgi:hypothetical protein